MGGGEGSTAREILRHRTVERVVMCDIDQVIFLVAVCTRQDICMYLLMLCVDGRKW